MFKKVLIAEDHEIANISVQTALHDLGIGNAKYVYYCDHALNWIKKALEDGEPYDLLVTDIQFEDDGNPQVITSGISLAKAVKSIQPNIKVIILTAQDRSRTINEMFSAKEVDAFVRKGRRDRQYLCEALQTVYRDKTYQSPDFRKTVEEQNSYEFTSLDVHIIKMLQEGIPQKRMPQYLGERNIRPNSLSSIEKRLGLMKEVLGFSKNEQLVMYCKEIGVI